MLYGYEKKTGKLDKKTIGLIAEKLKSFHDGTQSNEFNLPQVPFPDKAKRKSKKEYEVVTGNGKDLDISPVYDHIDIDFPGNGDQWKLILVTITKNGVRYFVDIFSCIDN